MWFSTNRVQSHSAGHSAFSICPFGGRLSVGDATIEVHLPRGAFLCSSLLAQFITSLKGLCTLLVGLEAIRTGATRSHSFGTLGSGKVALLLEHVTGGIPVQRLLLA